MKGKARSYGLTRRTHDSVARYFRRGANEGTTPQVLDPAARTADISAKRRAASRALNGAEREVLGDSGDTRGQVFARLVALFSSDENLLWLRVGVVYLVILVVIFTIYVVTESAYTPRNTDLMLHFAVASIVILLAMFVLNLSAYRFFGDVFYLLLSIGWLANAMYILSEALFPSLRQDLRQNLTVFVLSTISLIPIYLAGFVDNSEPTDIRQVIVETIGWAVVLVINFVTFYAVTVRWPDLRPSYQFMIFTASGVLFATYSLIRAGNAAKARLDKETYHIYSKLFPLSFYLFASIQFIYLFKMVESLHFLLSAAFCAALIFKVVNGVSVINIISYGSDQKIKEHYLSVQDQLTQKSVLEEIGALAASIEHDIRNPLGVIENEIGRLSEKFQANPELVNGLKYIEEQRGRIFAATEIIPLLRADRSFFDRFMDKLSTRDMIARSIKDVEKELNTTGIRFTGPDNLLFVRANRKMLEQALVNILRNSVEAIREAERSSGLVKIRSRHNVRGDGLVRIEVTDNGCGIPDENLGKVKAALFTTRRNNKANSGLGLFITDRIAKIHAGRIDITSTVGKGTTVSLLLPEWVDRGKGSRMRGLPSVSSDDK